MLFSSLFFLQVFLPAVCGMSWILKNGPYSNFLLLTVSLFFYAWGEPVYVFLLMGSIIINYFLGRCIDSKEKSDRRFYFILGVCLNLLLLIHYKYFDFLCENINLVFHCNIRKSGDIMPIGISFFTFQAISYLADVYRKEVKSEKNILDLALYISFFPQLIAGPIIKFNEIAAEIKKRVMNVENAVWGIRRFVIGLAKKVLLANSMALIANDAFSTSSDSLSALQAWLGIFAYSMQIYYDFSGYSDMAIGLGRFFGFTFPENFNYPYMAVSMRDFWKRWHISLSSWFKEYLYFPLGGSRYGELRTVCNLMCVFLATGIWHGASWNFIFWGVWHGLGVLFSHRFKELFILCFQPLTFILTQFYVMIGWVWFRADDFQSALKYLKNMFVPNAVDNTLFVSYSFSPYYITLYLGAILCCGLLQRNEKIKKILNGEFKISILEPVYIVILLVPCLFILGANTYNPFIYFRF